MAKKSSSTSEYPKISIVTPVYNREELAIETIESIVTQDYPNIQYLLIDDGSSDSTFKVIKRYEKKYPNIVTALTHKNVGQTRTVNRGFKLATGDLVGVVNSDDPLLPGALADIANYSRKYPDVGVFYPDWVSIDENGNTTRSVTTEEFDYDKMLRRHLCIPGPGAFFRKSILDRLGGWDGQFTFIGDFDFWLRAGLITNFKRIPKVLATFRVHPASASVEEISPKMADEHIRVVEKIYRLPNFPSDKKKYFKEATSLANYIAGVTYGAAPSRRKKQYFWSAISACPLTYLQPPRDLLRVMLDTFFNR